MAAVGLRPGTGLVSGRTAIPDLQVIVAHMQEAVKALAVAAGINSTAL
jgi:hypothetical protein